MISWIIIQLLRVTQDQKLTKNGITIRFVIIIVLLCIYSLLFVLLLRSLKKARIRKGSALFLSTIIAFEAAILFPFLQGIRHAPLEYVCSVETTRDTSSEQDVIWYTNCSIYSTPIEKPRLEEILSCDLADVNLDEDYTYLFVYSYRYVDLEYSNWKYYRAYYLDQADVPKGIYWIGSISVQDEAKDNIIYVFRFPRKTIVPDDLHGV